MGVKTISQFHCNTLPIDRRTVEVKTKGTLILILAVGKPPTLLLHCQRHMPRERDSERVPFQLQRESNAKTIIVLLIGTVRKFEPTFSQECGFRANLLLHLLLLFMWIMANDPNHISHINMGKREIALHLL